jgi:hypothetical protein
MDLCFDYELIQKIEYIRAECGFDETCPGSFTQAVLVFLESANFEDIIRNAISLGGNNDTQAGIKGALAEAYYKLILDEIAYVVYVRLTPKIKKILNQLFLRPKNKGDQLLKIYHSCRNHTKVWMLKGLCITELKIKTPLHCV